MKRPIFIIILLVVVGLSKSGAQQTPHFSQYMFNPFIINPALAGTHNYYQIRTNNRFQWVGVTDPPVTNCISMYGPHGSKDKDMGFGGFIYNDVTGPTSRTGISGAYAYNIAINDEIRLSMGVAVGVQQFKVDGTKVSLKDDDLLWQNSVYAAYVPDAKAGVYLYSSNFHVGFSADQLINNKLKLYDQKTGLSKLKSHFYLVGGYKYFINREFALEPSILVKATSPVPVQMDLSTRVIYQNMVWMGLAFRSGDAAAVYCGYNHEDKIYIGYSYDIGVSSFRKYNSGSHELMIGYKFNALK